MVSFSCNVCQATIKKPKLDAHVQRCRNASFCCIDCGVDFVGTSYRAHTSCMTEVEKYQGKAGKHNGKPQHPKPAPQQQKPRQAVKSTVDQLLAMTSAPPSTTGAAPCDTRSKKHESGSVADADADGSSRSKKARTTRDSPASDWESSALPNAPADALVHAISAYYAGGKGSASISLDELKKKCVKMVLRHPENKWSKSEVKDKFNGAVVSALAAALAAPSKRSDGSK
ncbi:hypothetical protein GGI07_004514 [Coemansia sp. Benny D115]|nr:hypothetical protein GGI07_004514 [Coemansia sp. Benny D115]